MWVGFALEDKKGQFTGVFERIWRREWDSNPRYGFPHTRFPSVRLKPLGHLSGAHSLEGAPMILQGIAGKSGDFSLSYCISWIISGAITPFGTVRRLNRRRVWRDDSLKTVKHVRGHHDHPQHHRRAEPGFGR